MHVELQLEGRQCPRGLWREIGPGTDLGGGDCGVAEENGSWQEGERWERVSRGGNTSEEEESQCPWLHREGQGVRRAAGQQGHQRLGPEKSWQAEAAKPGCEGLGPRKDAPAGHFPDHWSMGISVGVRVVEKPSIKWP